jgi:hypothetical protein
MKIPKITPVMFTGAMMLWIIGCTNKPVLTHKLVVTGNQHSVPLYPDEQTYLKVSHLSQQGGVSGMVGDAQKNLPAKKDRRSDPGHSHLERRQWHSGSDYRGANEGAGRLRRQPERRLIA